MFDAAVMAPSIAGSKLIVGMTGSGTVTIIFFALNERPFSVRTRTEFFLQEIVFTTEPRSISTPSFTDSFFRNVRSAP